MGGSWPAAAGLALRLRWRSAGRAARREETDRVAAWHAEGRRVESHPPGRGLQRIPARSSAPGPARGRSGPSRSGDRAEGGPVQPAPVDQDCLGLKSGGGGPGGGGDARRCLQRRRGKAGVGGGEGLAVVDGQATLTVGSECCPVCTKPEARGRSWSDWRRRRRKAPTRSMHWREQKRPGAWGRSGDHSRGTRWAAGRERRGRRARRRRWRSAAAARTGGGLGACHGDTLSVWRWASRAESECFCAFSA